MIFILLSLRFNSWLLHRTPEEVIESTEKQTEVAVEIANDFNLEAEDEKILDIREQPEVQVGNVALHFMSRLLIIK